MTFGNQVKLKDTIMSDIILRRIQVEQMIGLSRSTIYSMMSHGLFPKPIRLGQRAVGWRQSVIMEWLNECEHKTSDATQPMKSRG